MTKIQFKQWAHIIIDYVQNNEHIWFVFAGSILLFALISLGIFYYFLTVDEHYFVAQQTKQNSKLSFCKVLLIVFNNILGYLFILIAIVTMIIPGQSIPLAIIGLSLIDFPGKRKLINVLFTKTGALNFINRCRMKTKRPALIIQRNGSDSHPK